LPGDYLANKNDQQEIIVYDPGERYQILAWQPNFNQILCCVIGACTANQASPCAFLISWQANHASLRHSEPTAPGSFDE